MSMLILNSRGSIPFNHKMYNFYVDHEFVDTELVLADGKIKSHSLILAAESKTFYNMLTIQTETQKTLTLTQFTKDIMRIILEFLYRGIVTYPSHNDRAINMALNFLQLDVKSEPTCESQVENIEDSVIEVKNEAIVIISDHEESGTSISSTTINTSKSPKKKIVQSRGTENFTPAPSRVFNESYDFLSSISNRSIEFEDCITPNESSSPMQEGSSPDFNNSLKQKGKDEVVRNPFSEYVNKESQQTSSSEVTKKQDTNTWINKKDNVCHFSKKYCLVCEKKTNFCKTHIKTFHKKMIRFTPFFCKICSVGFFHKIFYQKHIQHCKQKN